MNKVNEASPASVTSDVERVVRRECWSGCGEIAECHPKTGYCAPCQKFHEKCLRESIKPRARQVTVNYNSMDRQARVGIQVGHVSELDFTEVDWQEALHPNEGCL